MKLRTTAARLRPAIPTLLAALAAGSAAAEDERLYQVEVLVFRHTQPAAGGELWVRPEPPPDPAALLEGGAVFGDPTSSGPVEPVLEEPDDTELEELPLDAETIPLGRFELLPADAYRLADAAASLARASRFSPLLHAGWIQPGLTIEESSAKGVSGSDAAAQVNGRVVLSRGRYLHLDLDLTLNTDDGEYRLRQSRRRVLVGRYNYIDHPLLSAIAIVTRAPEPEPEPAPEGENPPETEPAADPADDQSGPEPEPQTEDG